MFFPIEALSSTLGVPVLQHEALLQWTLKISSGCSCFDGKAQFKHLSANSDLSLCLNTTWTLVFQHFTAPEL